MKKVVGFLFITVSACCNSKQTPKLDKVVDSNSFVTFNNISPVKSETIQLPTTTVISKCPEDMVYVEGDFCPKVERTCIKVDKSVHNVNGYAKCDEFAPTKCLSEKKVHMSFCIDRYEASGKKGDVPPVMVSWDDGKRKCEAQGKKLCIDDQWTFACEGNEMLPYPYGYVRDSSACNIDHQQRPGFDASKAVMDEKTVAWLDQRVPSGSMPKCVSPFGVYDMTGNVDEATINSSGRPYKNALKGGHWIKGARAACRPATTAHNEYFANYESSYRCCKGPE